MFSFLKKQSCFAESEQAVSQLKNIDEYLSLVEMSQQKPFFLLKHSTRCPVSDWALTEFKLAAGEIKHQANFKYLDLLAHRDVSDYIAKHTGVTHQSPQLFYFNGGQVVSTVTHEEVKASQIRDWLNI